MTAIPPPVARDYANLGEQAHVPILHDALMPLMGDLRGRSLLDFGCGDGRLTCRLAEHGPQTVLCIDESQELLDTARRQATAQLSEALHHRFTFRRGDERLLPTAERFDVVVCSLMLMMCDRRERVDAAMAGMIASLAPHGRAFIILTHPCFRGAMHATFHNELPRGFTYWQSGRPYDVIIDPAEQQVTTTLADYHWTLEDYARAVAAGGGVIHDLREVPGQFDTAGQPVGQPAYLILVLAPSPLG